MTVLQEVFIPELDEWVTRDVGIDRGVFREIAAPGSLKGIPSLSAEGLYLMPAWIDPHVHVRDPGYTHKEDWVTCTKAALRGGFSTILDMPNNRVPTADFETLQEKMGIAKIKSYTNFGLHIALTESNIDMILREDIQRTVCGIKIYMAKTTGGITVKSDQVLLQVFGQPKPVMVHTGGGEGLSRILSIYERAGNITSTLPVLYICHVSTRDEVSLLRKWKRKYPRLCAEVTPHHLFLQKESYNGPPGVLPPLGTAQDNEALWEGITQGVVDFLGTDHAPHTLDEKGSENPPSGFPGLETALPLMMNAVREKRIGLQRLSMITSHNARKLFHIREGEGIKRNASANCVLLQEGEYIVGEEGYVTKCGWSPFHGWRHSFRPVITMVNGDIAYERGRFVRPHTKMVCCT
jgi:dihydroorotase